MRIEKGVSSQKIPISNCLTRGALFWGGGKWFIWIQEGFTAEPPRNDSGADFQGNDSGFGPKVRVTGQKSELQAKSRGCSGADPQNPNRIAQKRNPNRV